MVCWCNTLRHSIPNIDDATYVLCDMKFQIQALRTIVYQVLAVGPFEDDLQASYSADFTTTQLIE